MILFIQEKDYAEGLETAGGSPPEKENKAGYTETVQGTRTYAETGSVS